MIVSHILTKFLVIVKSISYAIIYESKLIHFLHNLDPCNVSILSNSRFNKLYTYLVIYIIYPTYYAYSMR